MEPTLGLDVIFALPPGPEFPVSWVEAVSGQLSEFGTGSPTVRCHSKRKGLVGHDWGVQEEAEQLQQFLPTDALRQLQRRHSIELSHG